MHNAAMRRHIYLAILLSSCVISGCTHWETTQTLGDRREVARRLVGSPQIEEVTSSSLSAGGAAGARSTTGGGVAVAGVSGSRETVKRTHCVQQAEVDYTQQLDYESHIEGRTKDVVTGLLVGGIGLVLGAGAYAKYHSDLDDFNSGVGFQSTMPKEPTLAYAATGAALLFAGGWLVYSFAALPKGAQPVTPPSQKTWTETTFVEATGCGLVPSDRPAAPAPAPATN